jgi:hypothetical protein
MPSTTTDVLRVEDPTTGFDFGSGDTAFGFFPSPPRATFESVLDHFQRLSEHSDFILVQPNIPWEDFLQGVDGESKAREDIKNQVTLARQFGLGWIFVVDPLNGLNRREFKGLPESWPASFSNPDVRQAFVNFSKWIVREFEPAYLGLASEINTYMDAYPDDVEAYVSLYKETYAQVKSIDPDVRIFVTFQWDDLNNMFPPASEGRAQYATNWDQVEVFEPYLDLWVISSYPYFAFPQGMDIPGDYYAPLLEKTDKPLAVAEGGWSSMPIGPVRGDEAGQEAYLQAIHDQLGERLDFWVYLILSDLDMDSISAAARDQGPSEADLDTLNYFQYIGLTDADGEPKSALAAWDALRAEGR